MRQKRTMGIVIMSLWRIVGSVVVQGPSLSAGSVAREETVEHGQFHPLLVSPTPGHDRPLAVSCVEVVTVT